MAITQLGFTTPYDPKYKLCPLIYLESLGLSVRSTWDIRSPIQYVCFTVTHAEGQISICCLVNLRNTS